MASNDGSLMARFVAKKSSGKGRSGGGPVRCAPAAADRVVDVASLEVPQDPVPPELQSLDAEPDADPGDQGHDAEPRAAAEPPAPVTTPPKS